MNVPDFLQSFSDEWFTKRQIRGKDGDISDRAIEEQIEAARRDRGCPIISGPRGYCWSSDPDAVRTWFACEWRRIHTMMENVNSFAAGFTRWFPGQEPIQLPLFEEQT